MVPMVSALERLHCSISVSAASDYHSCAMLVFRHKDWVELAVAGLCGGGLYKRVLC